VKRISVDFNTLTSAPVGLVKLAQVGTSNAGRLPELHEDERVTLWEPGLEVEATIVLHGGNYWMARPDDATWRDLPLPREQTSEATTP
jgi:hypothetical protein